MVGSGRISNTRSNHSDILSIRHGEAWQIVLALTVFLTNQLAESFQPLILDQSAGGINSGSYFWPISWMNHLSLLFWTNQLDESFQPLVLDQSAGWIILASYFGPISWLNHLSLYFGPISWLNYQRKAWPIPKMRSRAAGLKFWAGGGGGGRKGVGGMIFERKLFHQRPRKCSKEIILQ